MRPDPGDDADIALNPWAQPHDDGPMSLYLMRVAAGELELDQPQRAALSILDRLHGELLDTGDTSLMGRLFGAKPPAPRSLYLFGLVGRGKSMLLDLFTETSPVPVHRVHFHVFMREVHDTLHQWRQMDARERRAVGFKGDDPVPPLAKKLARETPLLCLDELEITDIADAMIVGRLFQGLMEDGAVIVTTSNRHPRDLYEGGLNRQLFEPFIDLIVQQFHLLRLDADRDYRINEGGKPQYLTPLGEETRARMDALFEEMTEGPASPQTLTILGRQLVVPQASGRVARFNFNDLCARPLGSADFLALAEHYDTIFMDDIPLLGKESRNEARRFITFIDVIYDAGLEFVCSAAALPDRLYVEGDGHFEFQRTASRLEELARGGRQRRNPA